MLPAKPWKQIVNEEIERIDWAKFSKYGQTVVAVALQPNGKFTLDDVLQALIDFHKIEVLEPALIRTVKVYLASMTTAKDFDTV